jgi:hypothetical protein
MKNISGHSLRKVIAVTGLAAVLLSSTTACFGTFATTHRVWNWNATVRGDKWAKWGAFVGINIIPVYVSAVTFDLVFANSVEFWSGSNPMAMAPGNTKTVQGDAGETALLTPRSDGAIDVSVRAPDRAESHFTLARDGESVAVYDAEGTLLAHTR